MHKDIYIINRGLPKRDKLGIHADIEKYCLKLLSLAVIASFLHEKEKLVVLKDARVHSHILAQFFRTEYELDIITEKIYLRLSAHLVEIGKMLSGWITYETQKGP